MILEPPEGAHLFVLCMRWLTTARFVRRVALATARTCSDIADAAELVEAREKEARLILSQRHRENESP